MKALAYVAAHSLRDFAITETTVLDPAVGSHDLLVRPKAISLNPIDYKIRTSRSGDASKPVILGWDASGIVEKVGTQVYDFHVGDEVYYAGDLLRDGAYAELQAVDSRIVAKKPSSLSFEKAAAIPLTALTAWEALFERGFIYTENTRALIIGGAGGVGSMAIQLLKHKTKAQVIATASRPETIAWCKDMGADRIISHAKNLSAELKQIDVKDIDIVFCTTHSASHLHALPDLMRPFGHICLIEEPSSVDLAGFKSKSLSIHLELMFTKTLHNYELQSQGAILTEVARLVDEGHIKTTANLVLNGFRAENIKRGQEMLEASTAVGKIVVTF